MGIAAACFVAFGIFAEARAQQSPPDIETTIQKVLAQTAPLVAAYKAQQEAAAHAPKADPNASIRAQSASLTKQQKAEAQSIFTSAFSIWQAGDMAAARIAFERGLAIDPANAAANFYEGDILTRASDTAGAAKYYERAAAFGGASAEGFRAEAALKALPPRPVIDPILDAAPVVWRVEGVGTNFQDCANCPEMVIVPAGVFTMGSPRNEPGRKPNEGPRHRVTIERPFAVARFELTFAAWDTCVADGGCGGYRPKDEGWGRGTRPVINVSWWDAQKYVTWLSQKTHESYHLLSEAEWEYAARAGTSTAYPWGDSLGRYNAHCDACGTATVQPQTQPVDAWGRNSLGLYSMLGNVVEWTEDCYGSYAKAPTDGSAAVTAECEHRVARGGDFSSSDPSDLRSANRGLDLPTTRDNYEGFRVARTL